VKRVLVTGMSGTGKSSLLDELAARGYRTVDTDTADTSRPWTAKDSGARTAATLEVVTTVPVAQVADIVLAHVR
jgi:predicted ATPase